MKSCVHCGVEFKTLSNNTNPDWQKYCTRKCWNDWYEKSGRKQTRDYSVRHKAATYRWREKVKKRKLEERERKRLQIARLFKQGLRQDRYGCF